MLTQAVKQIKLWQVDHTDTSPTSLETAGVYESGNVTLQYNPGNDGNYCITATSSQVSYKVTRSTPPAYGSCQGHTRGGIAAVTNLTHAARIVPRGSVTGFMRDVSWNGQTWDAQVTATASNHGLRAHFEPSPDEVVSTVSIDIGDRQVVVLSVPPGEYRTLSATAVRPWSEVYRFLDIGATTDKSFLIRNPTIIHGDYGTITTYNGDSPHWLWGGAARESTSSGPLP